jgi:transposase-like protein
MDKFKWTPRKRRAAYLLACEPKKYTAIAKELNITVQTLWNYRQYPEFNRKVGQLSNRENQLRIETRIAIEYNKLLKSIHR